MKIEFKSIKIKNFLSFGESVVDLSSAGYCLVSGENYFKKDNALSNGSGKSTIWSAITYALTGETVQGLSSNLKNINLDSNECSVELLFNVDNVSYEILRIHKPKSDLKIKVNGEDRSGKGIRESEKILGDYLPDITKDLIATTIIIGQGMPNKFSSFSPSGRKELLEKLSKSDFMIEDLKKRIQGRLQTLNSTVRTIDDSILTHTTQLNLYKSYLQKYKTSLENWVSPDYDKEINECSELITTNNEELQSLNESIEFNESNLETWTNDLKSISEEKQSLINQYTEVYNGSRLKLCESKIETETKMKSLDKEIKNLKAIKDVCPTCGQKLPGVLRPDTTSQEQEYASLNEIYSSKVKEIGELDVEHSNRIQTINSSYQVKLDEANYNINVYNTELRELKQRVQTLTSSNTNLTIKLNKLISEKDSIDGQLNELKDNISKCEDEISSLTLTLESEQTSKNKTQEHIDVTKKMDTLVKRDFRGYLLQNVIKFIDSKAKEYCEIVFGTRELEIFLDGNALDISYCGKMMENLSGGERQRVDLILQFAIRDMMSQYLNFSSNIIVLDEIFDNLDKVATTKILDLITKKLSDIESIFIISHHSDSLEIPYDSNIVVIKDEYGISNAVVR
jgi:DNA repair exonuclease SbcCD ATPase subunit